MSGIGDGWSRCACGRCIGEGGASEGEVSDGGFGGGGTCFVGSVFDGHDIGGGFDGCGIGGCDVGGWSCWWRYCALGIIDWGDGVAVREGGTCTVALLFFLVAMATFHSSMYSTSALIALVILKMGSTQQICYCLGRAR